MKVNQLYQLPNGDWADPAEISSLQAFDVSESDGFGFCPPRLVVRYAGFMQSTREYPSYEKACEARDKIAKEVNQLRGQKK